MISTVTANGLRFAYLEAGQGPLVLLLHGFPDTAHTWDATLPALAAAGYRAVAPFMRGYHPTEIPAGRDDYDPDTLGRDALALIEALGASSAIVVGHDFGASAGYAAAAMQPARVRLLVPMAIPHPRVIRPTPRMGWILRHFLSLGRRGALAKLQRDDFALADVLVQRWSPAWRVPPGETDRVKEAFRAPGCADAALGYYRAAKLRATGALLEPIAVPTVAFAGTDDNVKPSLFERARRCFTGSYQVVTMPGGHFMHREHPAHFTGELVRVLTSATPA
jgi:pimeloyl-ACP methyl ester carboxylesterase